MRLKCCYDRLGMKKEAKEVATSISQFQRLQQSNAALPTMCHLFLVGWITPFSLQLFMKHRLEWVIRCLTDVNHPLYLEDSTSERFPGKRFQAMFSMVPFAGGQWFTATICLPRGLQVQPSYFQLCFATHDLDLEKPPNGIIHPQVTHLILTHP